MVSPLFIEIALHYHCRVDDFDLERFSAPAVQEALQSLVKAGLLERGGKFQPVYVPTEGLKVWVDAICSVPFPQRRWMIPEPAI
jgi:hypothetical protein